MNYRVLFFISVLILAVGLGGLFMIPSQSDNETASQQPAEPTAVQPAVIEKKEIKMVMANKDLPAGTILKQGDYQINTLQVERDSPLVSDDVTDLLVQNSDTLNGFLISEKSDTGRFLPKTTLISPMDERFLFYTVDKDEVVFRVYLRDEYQFVLDTLKSGDIVGVFALQRDFTKRNSDEERRFDKVLQNLEVVKIERITGDRATLPADLKDYVGYVGVRMKSDQVKDIMILSKSRSLIVLPQGDASYEGEINKRGLNIRSLRGR